MLTISQNFQTLSKLNVDFNTKEEEKLKTKESMNTRPLFVRVKDYVDEKRMDKYTPAIIKGATNIFALIFQFFLYRCNSVCLCFCISVFLYPCTSHYVVRVCILVFLYSSPSAASFPIRALPWVTVGCERPQDYLLAITNLETSLGCSIWWSVYVWRRSMKMTMRMIRMSDQGKGGSPILRGKI